MHCDRFGRSEAHSSLEDGWLACEDELGHFVFVFCAECQVCLSVDDRVGYENRLNGQMVGSSHD
jgi:hypothetical protein